MKHFILISFLLLLANKAISQHNDLQYFITGNGNIYIPIGNSEKGPYPILWYDKATDSKLLLGGLGVGLLATKPWGNKSELRGQANLSKHTYWEVFQMKDYNNYPSGNFTSGSSDYTFGVTASAHYFLSNKLSVGAGLGFQTMLVSLSRTPIPELENKIYRNRHYKPVMPVIPVELSYKTAKKIFNIRYEQGLLNRFKGEVAEYRKDHFGLLTFEVGFKVKG